MTTKNETEKFPLDQTCQGAQAEYICIQPLTEIHMWIINVWTIQREHATATPLIQVPECSAAAAMQMGIVKSSMLCIMGMFFVQLNNGIQEEAAFGL